MTDSPLTVAVSPCPNDTFIFGAWVLGLAGADSPEARFSWADVEELNESAAAGRFDVVKMSAATGIAVEDVYEILPCGGAFGTGAGPKLVTRPDVSQPFETIAVPGLNTTAYTVLGAALEYPFKAVPMLFSDIAGAVAEGRVDAGLLIHETALVPERYGLKLDLDLGAWWHEHHDGIPLPLGVIGVRRSLGPHVRDAVASTIRASLMVARNRGEAVRPLIKAFARELDDATLDAHIAAYVDDFSLDMGQPGQQALASLRTAARILGRRVTEKLA